MGRIKKTGKQSSTKSLAALAAYLSFGQDSKDDELLRMIMEIGVGMMHVDEGSLLLLDREKEELEFMMTIGRSGVEQQLRGQRFSMHKGISGLAASTGEPQTGAPTYHGVKQPDYEGRKNEPAAVLAAPMLVGEEVVGVITAVTFKEGRTFSSEDVQLYSRFADLCGAVIRQRRREEAVSRVLIGRKSSAPMDPAIKMILADHALTAADRAVITIAKTLGVLSREREDLLPQCAELIGIVAKLARDAG